MTYDSILIALADPSRRQIFEHLAHSSQSVGQLAKVMPISRPAVSQHLKVLSDAGLLQVRSNGTQRVYSAAPEGLAPLRHYLDGLWDDALAAFARAAHQQRKDNADHTKNT